MTSLEKLWHLLNARDHVCFRKVGAAIKVKLRNEERETHDRETIEEAIDLLYEWTVEDAWKRLRPCESDLRHLGVPVQCEVPVATPSESATKDCSVMNEAQDAACILDEGHAGPHMDGRQRRWAP